MRELVHLALSTTAISGIVACAAFLFFGSIFTTATADSLRSVTVRDTLMKDGSHRLSGMIMVPSVCDEISSKTERAADGIHILAFSTWREPYHDCAEELTPRAFSITLFAADDAHYAVTLNDAVLPSRVLRSKAAD